MPRVGSAKIHAARLVGRCFSFVLAILILLSVCCGIAKRTHRVQESQSLLCLVGIINALRFVNDNHRITGGNKVNRFAQHLIMIPVNDICLALFFRIGSGFAEGINIDNHNLNIAGDGKVPHLVQLAGIVNKVVVRYIIILRFEV